MIIISHQISAFKIAGVSHTVSLCLYVSRLIPNNTKCTYIFYLWHKKNKKINWCLFFPQVHWAFKNLLWFFVRRKKRKTGSGWVFFFFLVKKILNPGGRSLCSFPPIFRKFLECVLVSANRTSTSSSATSSISSTLLSFPLQRRGGGTTTTLQKSGMSFCVEIKKGKKQLEFFPGERGKRKRSPSEYIPHDLSYLCSVGRRGQGQRVVMMS